MEKFISIDFLLISFAVVCHVGAAFFALRLVKITGIKTAWILITLSIVVQLIRRMISLGGYLAESNSIASSYDNEIGLIISIFMLIGVAKIEPLFLSISNSEKQMKLAKIKAEEEKSKTDAIISAIGDGLCIVNRNFQIIYQNSIHTNFFGNHCGEQCYQVLQHSQITCNDCPVVKSFNDGQVYTNEMAKRTVNDISNFEITTSPIRGSDGQIIAAVEVVRNIDRRKKMEQEKEALIEKLQEALANIKTLSGLLPICASCKKIRDDQGYWNQIEAYISDHSEAKFSHGICPECCKKLYPEYYKDSLNMMQ